MPRLISAFITYFDKCESQCPLSREDGIVNNIYGKVVCYSELLHGSDI